MAQKKTVREWEQLNPGGYEVVTASQSDTAHLAVHYIGTKNQNGQYLLPKFTPDGRKRPFKDRILTRPPEWLNCTVESVVFVPNRNVARLVIRQEDLER